MARGGSSPLRRMEKPRKWRGFLRLGGALRGASADAWQHAWQQIRGGLRAGAAGGADDRAGAAPTWPRWGRPDALLDALGGVTEERLLEVPVERLRRGERRVAELALDVDERQTTGQPRGGGGVAEIVQPQRGPQTGVLERRLLIVARDVRAVQSTAARPDEHRIAAAHRRTD